MQKHISVVIPFFNENEKLLRKTIKILKESKPKTWIMEIILVQDGGLGIYQKLQNLKSCKFIKLEKNQGLGSAINCGFLNAKMGFLTWLPADGQISAKKVIKTVSKLNSQTQAIVFLRNSWKNPIRSFLTSLLKILLQEKNSNREFCGICIFYKKYLFQSVYHMKSGIYNYKQLAKLKSELNQIKFININVLNRKSGKSKVISIKNLIRHFLDILKYYSF